jgi:nitroreductase
MPNPTIEHLLKHRSIRKFKSRPIEPAVLESILIAGTRAATAGNLQNYTFIVVDDPEIARQIQTFHAPVIIVALVDQYRMKRWIELNGAPFYSDHIVNVLIPFCDALIALQNVVVAAESLGLGTVYDGDGLILDAHKILNVPEYVVPVAMVCLGYPDENPELRSRLPLEAVVQRNRYSIASDDGIRSFYAGKDASWDDLPVETRKELAGRGIHNEAQRITVGHYTQKYAIEDSIAILRNLKKAGFRLSEEG